jgi:uncharacterized membrane protein
MLISRFLLLSTLLLLVGCSEGPANPGRRPDAIATFTGLGDLPGGAVHSEALAVSDDGRVVVGRSSSANFVDEGFVRVLDDTLQPLLGPGGVPVSSEPRALTFDGAVIAGKIGPMGGPAQAARWTAATGWVGLGDLAGGVSFSQALGISANGGVIVGWGSSDLGYESARWEGGTPIAMGDLPGGALQSAAALVSADGTVIVGTGTSAEGQQVYRWTASAGLVPLGDLTGGAFASEPFGMTPGASVIVGEAASASGVEAFRWTAGGGFIGLGDLDGGEFHSTAFDLSADGATIVGFGTGASGPEAFVWDAQHGLRPLKDMLVAGGVPDLAGWQLLEATGISADGKTIIGNGTNPSGDAEGWIVRLR